MAATARERNRRRHPTPALRAAARALTAADAHIPDHVVFERHQCRHPSHRSVGVWPEVVLTERGQPIAVIKPIREKGAPAVALQAMVDEGFLKPASRKGPTPELRWRPVKIKGEPLAVTVIDGRDDRV